MGQLTRLRNLELFSRLQPGEVLDSLLLCCKGNLQWVKLPPRATREQVLLLTECPRLRQTSVPFLKGIFTLQDHVELTRIELNAEREQPHAEEVEGVASFLWQPKVQARLKSSGCN